ncbi:ATP-binding protein [Coxiella-like endosymbiont of Rhipicephalus sanguineus]|uniref:ATP-binding protein n=1 Tax=Coxiella-like endosymbiont of Rhipicephalus sanguineus TaxID=1955402 RepID=UPI00203B2C80|nr:ATP-binding protein [Coxiella-like endosymbiont of Rhipicephalus sanguineus]
MKGQLGRKRALEITACPAAIIFCLWGSPPLGQDKTILARRLEGILLSLTVDEALEIATVYSLSKKGFDFRCWRQRPFRASPPFNFKYHNDRG